MLGVSPKKTDNVDLARPLTQFLKSNFSKTEAKSMEETLLKINKQRESIAALAARGEGDAGQAAETYFEYYRSLCMLGSRFTFGRHQGSSFFRSKVKSIMVPFTWYDAFRSQKSGVDYSLTFEKAAVLFNIGAFFSLCGIKEDRSTPEGLKRAAKHFAKASGVFTYLTTHGEYDMPLTPDMGVDSYRMLSHLMLAQAQACFFEQAIKNKFSAALIAKLAQGTSSLFHHAFSASERPNLKQWLDAAKYRWQRHMFYQFKCFLSAAHFWQAKTFGEDDEYGQEIAHLYLAKDRAAEAQKYEAELIQGLVESRAKLYELVLTRLRDAIKDNDSIYHYSIPQGRDVKEIEQKFVVKAEPFEPAEPANEDNPFNQLVPIKVQEEAARFLQQLNGMEAELSRECQEATDVAKTRLASLNLPAALEALEPDAGFPASVWERVQECQLKGGVRLLIDRRQAAQELCHSAWTVLNSLKEKLRKEAADDSAMREKYKTRWNRVGSAEITANFRHDSDTVEQYLLTARQSDAEIAREMEQSEEELLMLDASRDQLEQGMPQDHVQLDSQRNAAADQLRQLLDELSELLDTRGSACQNLKSLIAAENPVPALLAAEGVKTSEQAFVEEKKKFEPMVEQIQQNLGRQESIMERVTSTNERFVSGRKNKDQAGPREVYLQGINLAVEKFNKLLSNLSEGHKFYADLMKDYLQPLEQTVDDFIMARDEEKRTILEQITSQLARYKTENKEPQPQDSPRKQYFGAGYPQYQPSMEAVAGQFGQMNMGAVPPPPHGYGMAVPAHNPNVQYQNFSQPRYPGGMQPYGVAAPQVQPSQGPGQSSEWTCPACTYSNKFTAMVCEMCNTDNPSPPPPRSQAPQQQQQQQQAPQQGKSGWRSWFGGK